LSAHHDQAEHEVIVEIPKGSRNKYEMDHDSGAIWLDRTLFTSITASSRARSPTTATLSTRWCSSSNRRFPAAM